MRLRGEVARMLVVMSGGKVGRKVYGEVSSCGKVLISLWERSQEHELPVSGSMACKEFRGRTHLAHVCHCDNEGEMCLIKFDFNVF